MPRGLGRELAGGAIERRDRGQAREIKPRIAFVLVAQAALGPERGQLAGRLGQGRDFVCELRRRR